MSAASQRPWPFTNYVGKPMAGVEFKVSDTLGNSSSVVVDSLSLVPAYSNVLKSAVYYADVVITNLTPLVPLRCDITTYPLIGNSSAVFSTTNNLFTGITSAPSSITNMYDPTNAYSKAVAVVSTSGSDTLGRVGTNDPTVIPSTNYFLTWAKAAQAIRTNNSTLYGTTIRVVDLSMEGAVTILGLGQARHTALKLLFGSRLPHTQATRTSLSRRNQEMQTPEISCT